MSNGDNGAGPADTQSFNAYNEQSYAGKLLHVDRDGRGLPGHPFCPTDTDLSHICTKATQRASATRSASR